MAAERTTVEDLGQFLRQQRNSAQLSLRQLASRAGVSNPYLSQVERGLRRPSAEVLQQLAKALQISATAVYTRAGLLDEATVPPAGAGARPAVVTAVLSDPHLDGRQRQALIDIYTAFVSAPAAAADTSDTTDVRSDLP